MFELAVIVAGLALHGKIDSSNEPVDCGNKVSILSVPSGQVFGNKNKIKPMKLLVGFTCKSISFVVSISLPAEMNMCLFLLSGPEVCMTSHLRKTGRL